MRRALGLLALVLVATLGAPLARGASAPPPRHSDSVVAVGHHVRVSGPVDRVVVIDGDVELRSSARVSGDVVVLFGALRRAPGAQVGGSEYLLSRGLIDWIPGPGWLAGVVLLVAFLTYRVAVWAAVCAIAATLRRTAAFERWTPGWEGRPGVALAVGILSVALALPALGLLALSGFGLPLALLGLAGLLVAAGAGLAFFREGPLWPRRPGRAAYAAYLLLPPALELGLLLTAAGGLGAGVRALTRAAGRARRGSAA